MQRSKSEAVVDVTRPNHPPIFVQVLFQQAIKHQPAILFFDQVEELFRERSDDAPHSSNLFGELLDLWSSLTSNNHQVLIIGATNLPEKVDASFRDRFDDTVLIPLPNEASKKRLLERGLNIPETPQSFSSDQMDRLVTEHMNLFSCRTIESMLQKIKKRRLIEIIRSQTFVRVCFRVLSACFVRQYADSKLQTAIKGSVFWTPYVQHAVNPVSDSDPSPNRNLPRKATFKELGQSNVRPRPLLYDEMVAVIQKYKPDRTHEEIAR